MPRYAAQTEVPAARSRDEIERTLSRYGATTFAYGWEDEGRGMRAVIGFKLHERMLRFELPMPDPAAREFTHTPGRDLPRQESQVRAAWEQATRQRWRALALVIKAKLEAVEAEIVEFEQEFLAHIVLPDGRTVGEHAVPRVREAYLTGRVPRLLPAAPLTEEAETP